VKKGQVVNQATWPMA